jgi:hypothetical protein
MRERYLGMLAHKAVTLRSVRLPQRTAAAGVVLASVLLLLAQAVQAGASAQKEIRPVLRQLTARVAVAVAAHRRV